MPAAKERQRQRRELLKKEPAKWKALLEKDRKRKKKKREVMKKNKAKWTYYRVAENVRIHRLRAKKKGNVTPNNDDTSNQPQERPSPYRSAQALGKAVKRVRDSLPRSPRKIKAVAAMVAKQAGLAIIQQPVVNGRPPLDNATKEKVIEFYLKDDISWQAPGRKDRVIVRGKDETGKKTKTIHQAKYLLMSLSEAYQLFCETNKASVSLSKFCELRPKFVKTFDQIPHNVCVCSYHENIRLLLDVLSHHSNLPGNTTAFTEMMVCDTGSKECMSQDCSDCKGKIDPFAPSADIASIVVKYYQWQNNTGVEKVEITSTAGEIFEELKCQLKAFLVHVYVKRKQATHFDQLKAAVNGVNILLQVDFSENATLAFQDEIQSGHWSHKQATLFTSHAWIDDEESQSIVIVSDELQHDKLSVNAYMSYIFTTLKNKFTNVSHIDVFSDGASSQFKQRFLFSNLNRWKEEFGVNLRWHFFATSHGKGAVDGLGGTVKRSVWRYVRSGKGQAASPSEFHQVAQLRNPNIKVTFIPANVIQEEKLRLEGYWKDTVTVPYTHKMHCVEPKGQNNLLIAETSASLTKTEVPIRKPEETDSSDSELEDDPLDPADDLNIKTDLQIGDWVLVQYMQNTFPGEISGFTDDEPRNKVKVMHRSGSNWKWPAGKPDEIYYYGEQILKRIGHPVPIGNRGQFTFNI